MAKKFWTKSAHIVIESDGSEFNQCFTLSFSEKGNNRKRITSSLTPLYLTVSHTSKKLEIWVLGSSYGNPIN